MRVAAIDVGTNSVHLLVADVSVSDANATGAMHTVETARDQVELGSGGINIEAIAEGPFARGVNALARFRAACDSLGVEAIHCAATSAVREASNGADFCRAVKEQTGIHVRVIPGREEARLIYLGARQDLDFSNGRVLLFDVGGGSTELILCDAERALVTESLRVGHIRLTEQHHRTDPMTRSERKAIAAEVRQRLTPFLRAVRADDVGAVVGTSGTVRSLARIATLARGEELPGHEHGLVLRLEDLERLTHKLTRNPRSSFSEIAGMDSRRQRTIAAGALVVREVLRAMGKNQLVTSARSLRDGLVVDWTLKHRPELALSGRVPDPRRRSVEAVLSRYGVDRAHADCVTRFALQIFDATQPLHHLRFDDRRDLEFAALLHDVGHHIAGRDHHKHGQYLIKHTHMPGFTAPEIARIGNMVRYHRGGRPKGSHPDFAALDREDRRRVRILGGILRLSDGLDRGHQQNATSLDVSLENEEIVLHTCTREAPDLERWSALQRADLLTEALAHPVRVTFSKTAEKPPFSHANPIAD